LCSAFALSGVTHWHERERNETRRHGRLGSKSGSGRSPPVRWSILILRSKAVWLGDVEAASEAEAIAKGAEEFKQPKERLMAVKRA
jgi:hypothetical protein